MLTRGMLARVVHIRRRVVAPESIAGRLVMVEQRVWARGDGLGSVDILISRSVPTKQREALAASVLRQMARQLCGNDIAPAPESASFSGVAT